MTQHLISFSIVAGGLLLALLTMNVSALVRSAQDRKHEAERARWRRDEITAAAELLGVAIKAMGGRPSDEVVELLTRVLGHLTKTATVAPEGLEEFRELVERNVAAMKTPPPLPPEVAARIAMMKEFRATVQDRENQGYDVSSEEYERWLEVFMTGAKISMVDSSTGPDASANGAPEAPAATPTSAA